MRLDRQIFRGEDMVPVYMCNNCGKLSNNTDYWWPGHVHWDEYNYTLCNECLVELANHQSDTEEMTNLGSNT